MRDFLTVILFKDHLTPRTLRLPLSWLPRLGLIWVTVMLLTVVAGGLFVRAFFRTQAGSAGIAHMANEDRIQELEQQLNELKSSYDALQARNQAGLGGLFAGMRGANFLALPPTSTRTSIPARDSLSIRMGALKAQWKGNTLQISTSIEYIREDGGNQQGNLVILARGPQHIYAHPEGALNPAGADSLIKPESGEYFSVSRFREVRAAFGPIPSRESIKSIEIFLFGADHSLVFYDLVGVDSPPATKPSSAPVDPAAAREPAKPKEAPKSAAPVIVAPQPVSDSEMAAPTPGEPSKP